ncbi:hypothetical protein QUA41_27300 [Microcoleus sp. Pol11C1]
MELDHWQLLIGNCFWECDRAFDFFREILRAIAFFVDRPSHI